MVDGVLTTATMDVLPTWPSSEPLVEPSQLQYHSLEEQGEIRLFQIHKSDSYDARTCGTLIKTNLEADYSKRLKFTALSYEWASDNSNHLITVNGPSFLVRSNLHNFLLRYRQATGPSSSRHKNVWYRYTNPSSEYDVEYLWIDQICIDQSSNTERSEQVQLMSTIYTKAEYVISWLGAEPDVARYLECANSMVSSCSTSRDLPLHNRLEVWAHKFVSLRYWKRLWIHQEVLLGKTNLMFMAGEVVASRYQLTNLHVYHRTRAELFVERPWPPLLIDMLMYDESSWNWSGNLHLYHVVCTFSPNDCQDPRDKGYGLLGLVEEVERLKVDYSLSARDLFYKTVAKLLEIGILDISEKYTDCDGKGRASSRMDYLRQAEEMRRNLEFLANSMG
ncbi:HET-domain-containing protein [Tothia fuscella]|uniref:HET-domain-containing protein n=1 Tax=Tothia fuscella TaxID=1048955 RepID=A0A9P4NVN6_9PEZI|nr:HET-domain-containing protein [Tothia fuscella]